ncbi:22281_t:CDS:1 [Gigaspora margarita]|uniref:22281_t:CDS:1 n=1 Tax=Gigaspora margarita TaxID=4874 RepID=A0ABM8W773_GIGMA|nr:22281_t:CDS:1 [Gigaspora margarita]
MNVCLELFANDLGIIKFGKILILQSNGSNILGCVSASLGILEYIGFSPANVTTQNSLGNLSNLYNVPIAISIGFTIVSFVLTQTGATKAVNINHDKIKKGNDRKIRTINTDTNHSPHHNTRINQEHVNCPCPIHQTDSNTIATTSRTTSRSIPSITQAPSINDIFNAAQFFVTTALVSLSNLSSDYRNLASKLSWLSGLPNSFNIVFLSNICDKDIRNAICHMTNICKTSTGVDYMDSGICGLDMSSGFSNFGRALKVPVYDLFFIVIISFCSAQALALGTHYSFGYLHDVVNSYGINGPA